MKTKRLTLNGCLVAVAAVLLILASTAVSHAQTIVWQDNFERADPTDQWSVDNGVWEFGAPLTGPATNSAGLRAHQGTNSAATILNGNYPANTSSRMIRTSAFVVPAAANAPRLQFFHWYQFSGNSYGVVQIKTNGVWVDASPRYYSTGSGVWSHPVVDLRPFAGKVAQVAFQIVADGNVADGWLVDEVSYLTGAYQQPITPNVVQTFESGIGDWSAETGTWEVGVPTSGPPTNALGRRAHSGTNCVATVLGGNYTEDQSSRFASPPFVVPAADQNPRLRFWEWWSIGAHDWAQVQIKVGTNVWQGLSGQITADSFGRWTRAWLDLTQYAGQTVQLGFYFESHSAYNQFGQYVSSVGPGWYVDEVNIETGPLPPATFPEGFENGWGGWRVDYIGGQVTDFGIWEIGKPTYGPSTNALGLRAHSGTNCAATVLNGDYPEDRTARLFSPPFVVPSADQLPRLRFWQWYNIGAHDFCEIQIKVGTNAWQALHRYTGYGSGVWNLQGFDLSGYAGQSVQLGFYFESHSAYNQFGQYVSSVGPGWYVDEVALVTGPIQPLQPNVTEGFESGWRDWYAEDGTWEVGVPTSGPTTNTFGQRAHGGTNSAATVLGGDYAEDTSGRFISPPFVVPAADQNPRLRFWQWWSIGAHDWAQVQIRVGTNAWQALSDQITADSFGRWTRAWLDLTQYAGQTVQLGFYFESHSAYNQFGQYVSSVGPGWYVDEVNIETGPLPPATFPEGFENGWGGWRVDYIGGQVTDFGIWEIGKPTYGPPTNALGLRAHSGTNCAATVLNGDDPEDRTARLFSPPFVVPSADQLPRLRFWQWYNIGAHDFCEIQIKVGTNAWQALHRYTGYGSGVWNLQGFDLSGYAGQSVQLGFYFESHSAYNQFGQYVSSVGPGWYVDEVALVTGPIQPLQPNVTEGFESGWRDWYAEDGTWEVGVPTSGPTTNAFGQRAHGGTNSAATVLCGDYAEDTSGRLVSPPFVVPSAGAHPALRFWHWFSIGLHDFCQVQIRVGTNSWQNLSQQYTGSGGVWSSPSFDLSGYAGQTVQLGFYFESHSAYNQFGQYVSSVGPGWYVDDITITSTNPPTGIVEFTDCRYFVNEGDGIATITVARKYGTNGPASVDYLVSDGSAIGPDDFDADVNTLSWADGEGGVKSFTVTINPDASDENNETVSLSLAVPGPLASVVARTTATLVIVDDDGAGPTVTNINYLRSLVGTTNFVPTNTSSVFTVEGIVTTYTNLSLVTSDELCFIQDGTNGIAVQWRGGTNQFMPPAGARLRVTAPLTNANGLLVLAPAYTNINHFVWPLSVNNALPPAFALNFTTRTNVPTMEALEARYVIATNVWVSQSGGIFPTVLTNILLTNQAGVTFNLTINPNTDIAGKPKPTQAVTILGVLNQNDPTAPYTTNYSLLPTRYADIVGGDPGVIQWCPTTYAVLESGGTITLSACRTGASNGPVSATVSTATILGTAVAGADFINTNGVLSWADGEGGAKTLTVQIVNDSAMEVDEYFFVNLSGPSVGGLSQAQVTIVNDDFVVHPVSLVLPTGANAVFNVTPTANTLGFQWWHNGAAQSGATNATFTIPNVQLPDTGSIWVVVTTTQGAVTSSLASLEVAVPVTITAQPQSQTVPAGSPVSFCVGVSASSTLPLSYQWRRDGVPLDGKTNSCLAFAIAQTCDSATYSVVVNNPANVPVDSSNATLVVVGGTSVPTNGLGTYIVSNGCYVVTGSGEDIEGNEDRFFFVYSPLNGAGQVIARLSSLAPDNNFSEAGIMLRDGFTGGDRHVFLAMNAERRTVFRRRLNANYDSVENWHRGTNSAWLRLMRMGDTFTGHYSTNGLDWELVWWTTIAGMPTNLQAGLAVTAHRHTGLATGTFCDWSVGGLTPLSGTWPLAGPKIHLGGEPAAYPSLQSLGGFKMLTSGMVGDQFSVKYATDVASPFAAWVSLGVITNQYGVVPFLDPQALANPRRFYRLERVGP